MNGKENLHCGHRKRMEEKVLNNVDSLLEHELLEVLLFSFIPRKDTNELSHLLLRTFGSINNILHADAEKLKSVNGIGDKVASKLILIGKIFDIINDTDTNVSTITSFNGNKNDFINYFKGLKQETFIIILLDERYRKITTLNFSDKNKTSVTGDIPEIITAFAVNKPTFAIIAHNHPSGILTPSTTDDITTAKINLMCNLHSVTLIDHVIVTKDNAYSYHIDGRLQHIKDEYNFEKFFHKIKEIKND